MNCTLINCCGGKKSVCKFQFPAYVTDAPTDTQRASLLCQLEWNFVIDFLMKLPDTHRETDTETETESFLSIPQSVKFIADCKIESQHLTNTWFKLKLHAWLSPRSKMLLDPAGMLGCWQGGVTHSSTLTFAEHCAKLKLQQQLALTRHTVLSYFHILLLVSHVHESVLQVAGAGLRGMSLSWKRDLLWRGVARPGEAQGRNVLFLNFVFVQY